MAKLSFSTKRIQIDKANTAVVAVTAVAAFIAVFSLVASNALLGQRSFQSKVIAEKETARDMLKANLDAVDSLKNSYAVFTTSEPNALGGSLNGDGDKDGNNAVLVLDALPRTYDFPGLLASVEKVLTDRNYSIESITGVDDEIVQKDNLSSPVPEPIEMPFEVVLTSNYDKLQEITEVLEKSIRPFRVTKLSFAGSDAAIRYTITAKSYWQPGKNLTITTKEVQ